jgi:ketosteroid isomerase-like protein
MFIWWANEQFDPTDIVGDHDRAAVFGTFRYRSHTLDKVVTSPFAILIRVADGLITYLQFMEDTYATAASFRSAGSWTVHGDPSGQQLKVPSN